MPKQHQFQGTASPKHPVLNTPAQMRRGATALLPAASGSPLIKVTPDLKVVKVWIDGATRVDYDMPIKHLPKVLVEAFRQLVRWQESNGLQLAPLTRSLRPPLKVRQKVGTPWYDLGAFWASGPHQKLQTEMRTVTEVDPETGRRFKAPVANRMVNGDDYLQQANGEISYRVGAYFTVREHLAELPVPRSRRSRQ